MATIEIDGVILAFLMNLDAFKVRREIFDMLVSSQSDTLTTGNLPESARKPTIVRFSLPLVLSEVKPISLSVGHSVGRFVGLSVIFSSKGGKFYFQTLDRRTYFFID